MSPVTTALLSSSVAGPAPSAGALAARSGDGTWFSNPAVKSHLGPATAETFAMTFVSGVLACVPLTIGAIPFYARLVETAINDVDHGKVEAALMMGASGSQITWGVLVREALPTLIQSGTVTIITLLGYSAMAGTVGGGGLGDFAIQYGYNRNMSDVMVIAVVLIAVIVGVIQVVGDMLSRLVDHR